MNNTAQSTNGQNGLAIETRGLNLWYGDFQALYDVNLDIKNGRITSLIGPSGCGKTTLLRIAMGMIDPQQGEVRVFGLDPRDEPLEVKRRVGSESGRRI